MGSLPPTSEGNGSCTRDDGGYHDLYLQKWEEAMRGGGGRPLERVALLVLG